MSCRVGSLDPTVSRGMLAGLGACTASAASLEQGHALRLTVHQPQAERVCFAPPPFLPACGRSEHRAVWTMQLPAVCRTAAYSCMVHTSQAAAACNLYRTAYTQARLLTHLPALWRTACIQVMPLLQLRAMCRAACTMQSCCDMCLHWPLINTHAATNNLFAGSLTRCRKQGCALCRTPILTSSGSCRASSHFSASVSWRMVLGCGGNRCTLCSATLSSLGLLPLSAAPVCPGGVCCCDKTTSTGFSCSRARCWVL